MPESKKRKKVAKKKNINIEIPQKSSDCFRLAIENAKKATNIVKQYVTLDEVEPNDEYEKLAIKWGDICIENYEFVSISYNSKMTKQKLKRNTIATLASHMMADRSNKENAEWIRNNFEQAIITYSNAIKAYYELDKKPEIKKVGDDLFFTYRRKK